MTTKTPATRITIGAFDVADTATGAAVTELHSNEVRWYPAVVPGGVHETLLNAGVIEHPYFDQNEDSLRWVEERDWWYRTTFEAPPPLGPGERTQLLFHGLDTVAQIWLNGELLGHHENMFRPAEYDVTDRLQPTNQLVVRFSPPLAGLEASTVSVDQLLGVAATLMPGIQFDAGSVRAFAPSPELVVASQRRKAMFSWGWDFGPRIPSIGIWRPVELVISPGARITGHHVRTDAVDTDSNVAELTVTVEVDDAGLSDLRAQVRLISPAGAAHSMSIAMRNGVGVGSLTIPDAELWWTHDLGDPALYDVRIDVVDGADTVHDTLQDRIGIRTIVLNREPDAEGGRLFQFVLNGHPIFSRGANWLPASMMVGSVTAERHRSLISLARDGGMTMLRVWGGGVYELDSFYTAADELGVLIWQDFMFACADYPSDDENLLREARLEADYQVRRLRNRACIALWCGNNEIQLLHGFAYQQYTPGNWGWDIFHRILPEAVSQWDPTATYWPGSPWGEDTPEGFMAVNGVLDGDRHAWEVWHGFDAGAGGRETYASVGESRHFRRYANDRGRFISEFGIHASPVRATLERWIPETNLTVHSPSFDAHNKDHPKDKGDALLEIITGLPTSLDEYVDFTMASQAEGLKFGIEHYRRRQPLCSGTLVWQFNDVWPGITWSLVDHDTVPKAAYYYCARAYAPGMASFRHDDGELSLWISNSARQPLATTATVSLRNLDGSVELEEVVPVNLAPGASERVWSRAMDPKPHQYAWVASDNDAFPQNRLFFAEIKDLPLKPGSLTTKITISGEHSAKISISSDKFAYLVRITSPHADARFSDNYFDLAPGDARTIHVDGLPAGFEITDLFVGDYAGTGH